jgi:hypothetical protein
MKPVINGLIRKRARDFRSQQLHRKCPFLPPRFLYLKSKHKPSIPTAIKFLSKEFHQTLRLAECV